MKLTIAGAGRAAWTFATIWSRSGRGPVTIISRHGPSERFGTDLRAVEARPMSIESVADAELVLLAVSDHALSEVYGRLRSWIPPAVPLFHASGSLCSELLDHEHRFSLHPLCSLPPVGSALTSLDGALMVWEGTASTRELGEEITRLSGGEFRAITTSDKPLYHAAAVFGSNYVAASLEASRRLMEAAGITDVDGPLARLAFSAIRNWRDQEGNARFTGPILRGDGAVVRNHLDALEAFPLHDESYRILARLLLDSIEGSSADASLQSIAEIVQPHRQS